MLSIMFQFGVKVSLYLDMPNGDNESINPVDGDSRVQVIWRGGWGVGEIQANGEKMTHEHHEILDMLIKLCLNCINNGDNYHEYITHNQFIGKHNSFPITRLLVKNFILRELY